MNMSTIELRRKIGMVFQRPNPFPTMNIYENVIARLQTEWHQIKENMKGIDS